MYTVAGLAAVDAFCAADDALSEAQRLLFNVIAPDIISELSSQKSLESRALSQSKTEDSSDSKPADNSFAHLFAHSLSHVS